MLQRAPRPCLWVCGRSPRSDYSTRFRLSIDIALLFYPRIEAHGSTGGRTSHCHRVTIRGKARTHAHAQKLVSSEIV